MCKSVANLILVVGLVLACAAVWADDGGVIGVGGSVELMHPEHSTVRMVRETVDVKLIRDESRGWFPTAKVHCVFCFRNEGGPAVVKMGFPEYSYADAVDTRSKTSKLEHFRSWVDGKPIKTNVLLDKGNHEQSFGAWHVKDVSFARGQTLKVVDNYEGGVGGDTSGSASFEYTLKSGASWKGKIGEAVIRVDAREMLRHYIPAASPKGCVVRGGVFTWTLRDFEPKEDINVSFIPATCVYVNNNGGIPSAFYQRGSDGITDVYLRPLLENVEGLTIRSDGKTWRITYSKHVLELVRGSKTATLDHAKKITLPHAPFLTRGRLVVPAAAVARALGGTVNHGTGPVVYGTGYYLKITL